MHSHVVVPVHISEIDCAESLVHARNGCKEFCSWLNDAKLTSVRCNIVPVGITTGQM